MDYIPVCAILYDLPMVVYIIFWRGQYALLICDKGAMRRPEVGDGQEVELPCLFNFQTFTDFSFQHPVNILHQRIMERLNIHIGNLIRREVVRQGITVVAFAQMIGYSRANIYKLYDHASVDTALLLRISILLKHDFFQYYSRTIQSVYPTC